MAFDAKTDYMQRMKDYLAKGGKTSDKAYIDLANSRNEKIASDVSAYGKYNTPTLDSNGNAYVVNNDGSGYATVGKLNDGGYAVGANQRYATADEAKQMQQIVVNPYSMPQNTTQNMPQGNESSIGQMYDSQLAAQIAKINAARDKQVGDYNTQINQAPQQYQPAKNEASLAGAKQANAIKEAMAYAGQGVSGDNLTAQSANNAATTGAIASLNTSQQNLVNSLKKAIADAQASASADELSATATSNAAKIQAILNDRQQTIDNNMNAASLTGTYNGQRTMAGQEFDNEQLQNRANVIAQANYSNIQAAINKIKATNPNDPVIPYLEAIRQQKIADQASATASAQATQRTNALELWKTLGKATPEIASILGIPVNTPTSAANIAAVEQSIAQQNANTSAQNANTNAYEAQTGRINAETNRTKANNTNTKYDTNQNFTADDYAKYIESVYYQPQQVGQDSNGNPIYSSRKVITVQGKKDIEAYLTQLYYNGVSKDIINSLAAKYSISLNK